MRRRRDQPGGSPAGTAVVAAALAIVLAGCGAASDDARSVATPTATLAPTPTLSPTVAHQERIAAGVLHRRGALLAGWVEPRAVVAVAGCQALRSRTDTFDCWFGAGVDGEDPLEIQVELHTDGTLSKVLGGRAPSPGVVSSTHAAALLAADDRHTFAPRRSRGYACSPSARVDPEGRVVGTALVGQVCTTEQRSSGSFAHRYVEFAADGTATRDYRISSLPPARPG